MNESTFYIILLVCGLAITFIMVLLLLAFITSKQYMVALENLEHLIERAEKSDRAKRLRILHNVEHKLSLIEKSCLRIHTVGIKIFEIRTKLKAAYEIK
jgi:hypothetical protein